MRIGMIGCGNMATAMMKGMMDHAGIQPEKMFVFDLNPEVRQKTHDTFGCTVCENNVEVAEKAEVLFLAVKPQFYETVTQEICGHNADGQLVITVAPGKTLAWMEAQLGANCPVIRTMPNTPALVGEGITAYCPNAFVTEEMLEKAVKLFNSFGKSERISEGMIEAVIAVSGSSPAYVFMLIEAMADGAVAEGMPRKQAYAFAAQAVLGSAKMVLETGRHPGELKDAVCSPAGTTIEAVRVLEEKGFRSAVIEAMKANAEKARSMESSK